MMRAAFIAAIGVLALAGCEEGGLSTAQSSAKQPGQICALTVAQCEAFGAQEAALLPVLNRPAEGRSDKDDATVQLVLDTLTRQQLAADKTCTPIVGDLRPKATLVSASGTRATLMGQGQSVCTLMLNR